MQGTPDWRKSLVAWLGTKLKNFQLILALAEIISIKDVQGTKCYYVHYVDCKYFIQHSIFVTRRCFFSVLVNKRLDEWVTEESLDTRKVHFPRKDIGPGTGVTTPKKIHIGSGIGSGISSGISTSAQTSRPCSPILNNAELLNGNAVLAAALQKKMNRY